MLHPGAHAGMAGMIREAAATGIADPELMAEVKEMNFVPTCEQAAEGVHASVMMANAFHGRNKLPPAICASLALPRNIASLRHWPRLIMAQALWHKYVNRSLLAFCDVPSVFVRHASPHDVNELLYHCHPRQLFVELKEEQKTLEIWTGVGKPEVQSIRAVEKLFLDHLRCRLLFGVVWSFPRMLLEKEIVRLEPGAMLQSAVEAVAVELGEEVLSRDHTNHNFYKVIKSDYTRRFTLGGDSLHNSMIAFQCLQLCGREGNDGVFQPVGGEERFNLLDLLQRAGPASVLQDIVVLACGH